MNEIGLIDDDFLESARAGQPNGLPMLDLQVNGFAGVDFNNPNLTINEVSQACEAMRAAGIGQILATVITASPTAMRNCIHTIRTAVSTDPKIAEMIRGIHIEGPFISAEPGYVGAHPREFVCQASVDFCQQLTDASEGLIRLWTLAPEADIDMSVTRWLTSQKIAVAAGHSNASLDQLKAAIDAGLSLYTHLGNGCPANLPRHDNIIQRVLSLSNMLSISFIADGHHVPWFALRNYLQCVPPERVIIVSDCMAAAGLGPGVYALGGQNVSVDSDRAAWSEDRSHFAGSATSLPQMIELLQSNLDLNGVQIHDLTSVNPNRLLSR